MSQELFMKLRHQLGEKEKTIAQMRAALEADLDLAEKQTYVIGRLVRLLARARRYLEDHDPRLGDVAELLKDIEGAIG